MSRIIIVCIVFAITGLPLLSFGSGAVTSNSVVEVPFVQGVIVGEPESVFDSNNGCVQIDIPDAPARAFRDFVGKVHLFAAHYIARAMIGDGLNTLAHKCTVVYSAPKDPDPSHFQDNNWLYSFYTEDGRKIAALVHSEYDANEIPGMCATPDSASNCWWNTITFALSRDGGYSFVEPNPPSNLVASLPYPYQVSNRSSAYGYSAPTNIVKFGRFYYAMINDWPYHAQKYGPCLIRTASIFDPSSWRAWDGKQFSVTFANPYIKIPGTEENHVCEPVMAGIAESLVREVKTGIFVVIELTPDTRFGSPGLYAEASRDLIHWSKPLLIAATSDLLLREPAGKWTYAYASLLDPTSRDRSFSTISDSPYFYYVRSDGNHAPYARILYRRKIKLQLGDSAF